MARTRCLCPCHLGSFGDRFRADGVDVSDVVESAVACDRCRKHHTPALLGQQLANDPIPEPPEPASGTWEDDEC